MSDCTPCSCRASKATLPIVLGILAVATAIPAWVLPARSASAAQASAEGQTLGLATANAESISGLRVVSWDSTLGGAVPFEVKRQADRWVIPSQHDYPADGNTRVTRVAAGLLGAPRGRQVSTDKKDHESLGVIDPLEHDPAIKTGIGRRVTLTDATGAIALDLIIGARAETGEGMFYVRDAGKAEVYTAKVDGEISTRFVEYVEPDPFKLKREDIRGVAVVEYQLDPDKGQIQSGAVTRLVRGDGNDDWDSPQAPAGKRVIKTQVDQVLDALTALRLTGVRPFMPQWLSTRGFYLANQPEAMKLENALPVTIADQKFAIFGTEGRLDVTTRDGLRTSFMFGKIALGDDEDTAADAKAKDGATPGTNRYLAVFVTYDPSLDELAKGEAAEKKDDAPAVPKKSKKTGKDRAAKAQERFQRYFYVISDTDFKKLRPELAKLWEDKPVEPMAGATGKTVKEWLAANATLPGVTTLPSGLQYQVLASGPAERRMPRIDEKVRVAYKGTLVDGTVFDENADMSFAVNGVIKGWSEALQLMRPGDTWKLAIPPDLGYGEAGSPPKIGPSQILLFDVTLKAIGDEPPVEVKPAAEAKPEAKPEAK
jgi:FKBP-type peptidyl-prolyl cis-trans isomerase